MNERSSSTGGRASLPRVSVIIPCHDARPWIGECLASVFEQDYGPLEVIVVDDASVDGSADVVEAAFGGRVTLVRFPERRGAPAARNEGFRRSSGELIQWLDADDVLCAGKLHAQVQAFVRDPGVDVVYGDWRYLFSEDGGRRTLGPVIRGGALVDPLLAHVQGWWATPHAFLQRRETVVEWDETLPAAQDHDYWLRVAMGTNAFAYRPGVVALYRRHGGASISKDRARWARAYARVLDKVERWLLRHGELGCSYRRALAKELLECSCVAFTAGERDLAARTARRALELDPAAPWSRGPTFALVSRAWSVELACTLESLRSRLRDAISTRARRFAAATEAAGSSARGSGSRVASGESKAE